MKLLFDQNLSFKLCQRLADLFPGSSQVRLLGLAEADDHALWHYAKANGFMLVSQDSDFADMAASVRASAPKSSGCAAATSPPSLSKSCSATTPRPSPRSSRTLPPPVWRFIETMHRWATAPFCDVRNLEHETLKRGNAPARANRWEEMKRWPTKPLGEFLEV